MRAPLTFLRRRRRRQAHACALTRLHHASASHVDQHQGDSHGCAQDSEKNHSNKDDREKDDGTHDQSQAEIFAGRLTRRRARDEALQSRHSQERPRRQRRQGQEPQAGYCHRAVEGAQARQTRSSQGFVAREGASRKSRRSIAVQPNANRASAKPLQPELAHEIEALVGKSSGQEQRKINGDRSPLLPSRERLAQVLR